jgi:parallel beta-helix repeat protein
VPDPFTITQTGIDPAVPLATFDNTGDLYLAGNVYANALPSITSPGAPALGGGTSPAGVTVSVAAPTGKTAVDTPNILAAVANLTSALTYGPASLAFPDGTYQIDSNQLVIQGLSDFSITSTGGTIITQAPNRPGKVNNVTGDLAIIADCSNFTVSRIILDGLRDIVAPITPIAAAITSGQPSVTVAAGAAANFNPGQYLQLKGGTGTGEAGQSQQGLVISSVTPGAGSGGGDLVTFTANISNNYNDISSTLISDSFGPTGCEGAYLTYFEGMTVTEFNTVAGRSLTTEDQQNGLHLMNCERFLIDGVIARNIWQSPVKLGTGFEPSNASLTDGCQQGTVTNCIGYHGYDQGVSVWYSEYITISDCVENSTGWAGVSLSGSNFCSVIGNQLQSPYWVFGASGTTGGHGVSIEAGQGNQVKGNIIYNPYVYGIFVTDYPDGLRWGLSSTNTSWPTLTSYTEPVAAGTSVAFSSTTGLVAGAPYCIFDSGHTDLVTVATIVDGEHLTFTENTKFSHASGLYLAPAISADNVFEGNTILGSQQDGIHLSGGVRSKVIGNSVFSPYGVGITMSSASYTSGGYIGGDDSVIIGNTVAGSQTNSLVNLSGVRSVTVQGNKLFGTETSGSNKGIAVTGCTDCIISENAVTNIVNAAGIYLANGGSYSINCARCVVSGNTVRNCSGDGIELLNGDSMIISGNAVGSNAGNGINLEGVTNSIVSGNTCNSNKDSGIVLQNNGSNYCLTNRILNNTCRDDGSGVNVTNGDTFTQTTGILEEGNSNNNLFMGNEVDSNSSAQITTTGAGSVLHYNIVSGTISS